MSRLPLRVRLVAGFVVAMLVLLTAAGAFVYWRVEYALDRGLDTELDRAVAVIAPLVDASGDVTSTVAADATGTDWQVVDDRGGVLASGGAAPTTRLVPASDLPHAGAAAVTEDLGRLLPITDRPYRVRITHLGSAGPYLVVAVRRDHRDEALRELLVQLTLAGLGALAVAAIVGDVLARAALRPVERYRRRAEEIASGADRLRLDVPVGRDDEVTRLGHTLNDMLAALQRSVEHERRFVDDASHELRTPLTLLKSRIQLARRRTRSLEEHEATLDELAIDVARLIDLAEQLLALGAADRAPAADSEVTGLARDVVARRRLARPDLADGLTLELPEGEVPTTIEAHAFTSVLTNLIDNAYLHGAPPVHVRVRTVPGWTSIEVRDAGGGMSPDLMAQATERFTRSAEARSRPGAGLGLSIVEQMVRRADGELRLCCGELHSSHGRLVPEVRCDHDGAMTATVILPQV